MSPLDILLIVAGVGYLMYRRLVGGMVELKTLLVLPAVLTVVGVTKLHHVHWSATSVGFAALGIAVGLGLGLLRGLSVHLGDRNGELWMRYRPASVGLWIANFAAKGVLIAIEAGMSSSAEKATGHTLLLSVGLGMLAESAVVVLRAMRTQSSVAWTKGEDGAPHSASPMFEQARQWLTVNDALTLRKDGRRAGRRLRLPDRNW